MDLRVVVHALIITWREKPLHKGIKGILLAKSHYFGLCNLTLNDTYIGTEEVIFMISPEIFFSRNVDAAVKDQFAAMLNVTAVLGTGTYLGLPSMIGRSKKEMFKFIKDRIWKKIHSWSGRSLSKAGKEVMIKSVLQAIPTYFMSIFLIPTSLGDEIQRLMNSYWWGSGGAQNKGIRWLSWEKLAMRKEHGGLGFQNMYAFNVALLGKQGWRFMTQPDTLVARLFKAKYYPRCSFLEAKLGSNPSYVWRSICEARVILKEGTRVSIGTGETIDVWRDRWLVSGELAQPRVGIPRVEGLRVQQLLCNNSKQWNEQVVRLHTSPATAQAILNTPLFATVQVDGLVWRHEKRGEYSVRSAYRSCMETVTDNSDLHEDGDWMRLWQLRVPPKVKHFMWRLCRGCIPTRDRLLSKGMQCDYACPFCPHTTEDYWHAFLTCPKSTGCWSSLGLTGFLDEALDHATGFREYIFTAMRILPENLVTQWVMTMWSVWQARNDMLWQQRELLPSQIIHRGQALGQAWNEVNRKQHQPASLSAAVPADARRWHPPAGTFIKCNTDLAVSQERNQVGIGMCFRDANGNFIMARTASYKPLMDVHVGEALGLLLAIRWAKDTQLQQVIFELDAKCVVDAVNSSVHDRTEFGNIISTCKHELHTFFTNSHVSFVRREANMVAHKLARVAIDSASPHTFVDIPACIHQLIVNEMQ